MRRLLVCMLFFVCLLCFSGCSYERASKSVQDTLFEEEWYADTDRIISREK